MADQDQSVEMISFALIAAAGTARSLALEAHHQQTQLLVKEANGEHTEVNVMLVHAQDHLMTSMLAQELIAEMIELHRANAAK